MGAVEPQGFDGVLGGLGFAEPFAVGMFDEMVGEIVGTEIDERDHKAAEFWGRPVGAFGSVADVAGPVEVVEVEAEFRELRLRAEVIEFEVFETSGPFFFEEAVGASGAKVFADRLSEALVVFSPVDRGGFAAGEMSHGLFALRCDALDDGRVELFVLDLKVCFEAVQFGGFFGRKAACEFLLDELLEAGVGGPGFLAGGRRHTFMLQQHGQTAADVAF